MNSSPMPATASTRWRWSGTLGTGGTRGTIKVQTTTDGSTSTIDLRVGFAWNPDQTGTADGLVVYYANTAGSLSYDTYNDATDAWAGAGTFSSTGSHKWVRLAAAAKPGATTKVHIVASNSNLDILAYRWTGSGAPANEQSITADATSEAYPYWDLAFQNDPNYHLEIRHDWSGVPSGTTYTLKVKGYRVDENLNVQVLTPPSTWNTRITISATTNTLYTYTLTSSEYNSGAPAVRFLHRPLPGHDGPHLRVRGQLGRQSHNPGAFAERCDLRGRHRWVVLEGHDLGDVLLRGLLRPRIQPDRLPRVSDSLDRSVAPPTGAEDPMGQVQSVPHSAPKRMKRA